MPSYSQSVASWEEHFFGVRRWFFSVRILFIVAAGFRSWLLLDKPALQSPAAISPFILIVCVAGFFVADRRPSSIQASRGKMVRTRVSTGSSETSVSACSGSRTGSMRRSSSRDGGGSTTRFDHTRASGISRRSNTPGLFQSPGLGRPFSRSPWSEEIRQVRCLTSLSEPTV